jgi:hypothetical protein
MRWWNRWFSTERCQKHVSSGQPYRRRYQLAELVFRLRYGRFCPHVASVNGVPTCTYGAWQPLAGGREWRRCAECGRTEVIQKCGVSAGRTRTHQ